MCDLMSDVDAIILAHTDKARAIDRHPHLLGWFVGQVMKRRNGNADPQLVNEMLKTRMWIARSEIHTS